MDERTATALNLLNQRFYSEFGGPFSNTRHTAQPGVQKLVHRVDPRAGVLDIGCGNGTFAAALAEIGFIGSFTGIDFSAELLRDAEKRSFNFPSRFFQADLFSPELSDLINEEFNMVTCFAVLHHIPGRAARERVLDFARQRLYAEGLLILSNWQFLNSPKLRERLLPWSVAGIEETAVDPNDHLLDWKSGGSGLRYAHHFSQEELDELADRTGFVVLEGFYSDGKSGDLALYNVWQKR